MSRGLNSLLVAETTSDIVRLLFFVDLEFDSGTLYVHNGIGSITWGGNTYQGVGDFGAVEAVEETSDVSPVSLVLILSGLDVDLMDEVLGQDYYLRPIKLYIGAVSVAGALLADPDRIWSGKMDTAEVQVGQSNSIRLSCENDFILFERTNGRRYTDSDLQNEYPGDLFFEYIDEMVDKEVIWGSKRVGVYGGRTGNGGSVFPLRSLH